MRQNIEHRLLQAAEDFLRLAQKQFAGGGELQPVLQAVEQGVVEAVLQLRHLLTHRALGHVQFLRGFGKAEVACRGFKTLQRSNGGEFFGGEFFHHARILYQIQKADKNRVRMAHPTVAFGGVFRLPESGNVFRQPFI